MLLADEIDAALDPVADQRIEAMIAEQAKAGMAVVRVRHRSLDGLETRVLRLENGVASRARTHETVTLQAMIFR